MGGGGIGEQVFDGRKRFSEKFPTTLDPRVGRMEFT